MSILACFSLFFLSFMPLWISIIFVDVKSIVQNEFYLYTEMISLIVIILISVISFVILLHSLKNSNSINMQSYRLVSAVEEKTITAEFLLSYILPLFAFDFTQWDGAVLFLIYFSVLLYLCIKHNHYSVNIVLEFMKYKFYNCELINKDNIMVSKTIITKDTLSSKIKAEIYARPINNEYFIHIIK